MFFVLVGCSCAPWGGHLRIVREFWPAEGLLFSKDVLVSQVRLQMLLLFRSVLVLPPARSR
eukprot:7218512-Pyramimonas_sp.AAC.1